MKGEMMANADFNAVSTIPFPWMGKGMKGVGVVLKRSSCRKGYR